MNDNPFTKAIRDEEEAEARRLRHYVDIRTRYGDTDRDCYCTLGRDHHEDESPWYSSPGEKSTV